MAKKEVPGKSVAEILRLAETPSILDACKPLPDWFACSRVDEVLEQTKAASGRLESPELQHWMQTGVADYERGFNEEQGRIEARAAAQPPQPAPQAAPAVAESASGGEAIQPPDPERRLARLRAGGGSVKYRNGEWKFTGIAALVASEKAEGRKRRDEKTIRADLKEAAEAERDAKRAGPFQGLGA